MSVGSGLSVRCAAIAALVCVSGEAAVADLPRPEVRFELEPSAEGSSLQLRGRLHRAAEVPDTWPAGGHVHVSLERDGPGERLLAAAWTTPIAPDGTFAGRFCWDAQLDAGAYRAVVAVDVGDQPAPVFRLLAKYFGAPRTWRLLIGGQDFRVNAAGAVERLSTHRFDLLRPEKPARLDPRRASREILDGERAVALARLRAWKALNKQAAIEYLVGEVDLAAAEPRAIEVFSVLTGQDFATVPVDAEPACRRWPRDAAEWEAAAQRLRRWAQDAGYR